MMLKLTLSNLFNFFLLRKSIISDIFYTIILGLGILEFQILFNFILNYSPQDPVIGNLRYYTRELFVPLGMLSISSVFLFRDLKRERIGNRCIMIFYILIFMNIADYVVEEWTSDMYFKYPLIPTLIVNIDDKYADGRIYKFVLDIIVVIISATLGTLIEHILKKKVVLEAIKSTYQ